MKKKIKKDIENIEEIVINRDIEEKMLYKYSEYLSLHPIRDKIYNKLFSLFQLHSDLNIDELQLIAINIEKSIFNNTLSNPNLSIIHKKTWNNIFQNLYISTSVKIYNNLNPNSYFKNVNLIKRLFNKEFNEYDIVNLSQKDIFPERYQEIIDECIRLAPKYTKELEVTNDGEHRCGKCKTNKTTYYQLQTRSADESLSTYVHCHNCGNKWKYG
jgi:DNA-directed RNA polymerase subunit M/transcription elongation factor TFIIS